MLGIDARGNRRRARILLADDNAGTRDYVRRLLIHRYDVEAVPDGEAALASAGREVPDLVVTDATMPRIDGYGLVRSLRLNPITANVPILFLSARVGEDTRTTALTAGADEYLEKPFSAGELLTCVRDLLHRSPKGKSPSGTGVAGGL